MEKVIAIIGPTAVGKTALSFALAEHYGTDLISGDAYQIYRHMDIGTAKPTADELARYHHYLIDIAEPDEPYSAARFCDMAGKAIAEVNGKGRSLFSSAVRAYTSSLSWKAMISRRPA